MGERPAGVPYSPVPTVESGGGGGTPMSVHANPSDFGAQVSEAEEGAGKEAFDIAQKQQGMINETQQINGETELTQRLASLHGEYMTLSGTAAHDALPSYIEKAKEAVNDIRGTMHGQENIHGYDMLATRRFGYMASDWEGYAAGQVKKANQEAHLDQISAAQIAAGDPSIASNDHAFGEFVTGSIKHSAQSMLDEDHPGFTTNPETGRVNFSNDAVGKNAKAQFENNLNSYLGQAYIKRYDTLSNLVGPVQAYDKYLQNQDAVPPEARVQIESSFQPKIFNAHASSVVNTTMGEANIAHREALLNPKENIDIADAIHKFGEGGKATSATSVDGAMGGWQIKPDTFKQYKKPGEDINNPSDNEAVGRRIVDDLKQKFNNDPARVAVGYFSGPGNVAPAGTPTPWVNDLKDGNGKSVSSYVSDVTKGMGMATPKPYATNPNGSPVTQADYYQTHRTEIIAGGDAYADRVMPGNSEFKNAVRSRLHQQMNDAISDQKAQYNQDNNIIMRAFNGDFTKGKKPTSWDDLTAIPDLKDVIDRSSVHSSEFTRSLDARLTSRSAGSDKDTKEYGHGFAELYKQIRPADPTAPKITDQSVLYKAFADGDLNSSGVEKLQSIMTGKNSLEPHEEEIRKQSLSFAKGQITGADEGLGMKDPKGTALYLQYMISADAIAQKMHAEGKTAAEIYDPKGPLGELVNKFKRPYAEWTADMTSANTGGPPKERGLADIIREAKANPAKAEDLKKEAIKLGFVRSDIHAPTPED